MKIIRTVEIFRINQFSILYTVVINQTSENQLELDDYYMNTVMKLALNIVTKYESFLKKEKSMWKKIQHLFDKFEWMKTFKNEIQKFINYHMFELIE